MKLRDKVCLVTGSGSGIGRAMAELFAREGASGIAIVDRNTAAGEETLERIRQDGGEALFVRADVSVSEDTQRMVAATLDAYGRIDILCNNAGVGCYGEVHDVDEADFDACVATNLRGVFLGSKYAIPHMLDRGGGVIVNTASAAPFKGLATRAVYSATKGAVIAMTKAMAMDYAQRNIRVNCLCPGTVDSPWIQSILAEADDPAAAHRALVDRQPVGRLGTPEEMARAALYLASDDSDFMTGAALLIDGGLSIK
jgi:NAD(P)-dependent dehydrogenase (short-subunit alcohol dehydrogenase family)